MLQAQIPLELGVLNTEIRNVYINDTFCVLAVLVLPVWPLLGHPFPWQHLRAASAFTDRQRSKIFYRKVKDFLQKSTLYFCFIQAHTHEPPQTPDQGTF